MKKKKKILLFVLWLVVITSVTVLSIKALQKHKEKICTDLIIIINNTNDGVFITETDIQNLMADSIGIIVNEPLKDVNLRKINSLLRNNPFVEDFLAYSSLSGEIKIEITQRVPLVRVYNKYNESFYIDRRGVLMPLSEKYTARVMVAGGVIAERYEPLYNLNQPLVINTKPVLYKVYKTAQFINKDLFWRAMCDQILIAKNGDIEIVPKIGTHKIIIGDIEGIDEKLSRVLFFYKKVLEKSGWDTFESINVKYKNNVICS